MTSAQIVAGIEVQFTPQLELLKGCERACAGYRAARRFCHPKKVYDFTDVPNSPCDVSPRPANEDAGEHTKGVVETAELVLCLAIGIGGGHCDPMQG